MSVRFFSRCQRSRDPQHPSTLELEEGGGALAQSLPALPGGETEAGTGEGICSYVLLLVGQAQDPGWQQQTLTCRPRVRRDPLPWPGSRELPRDRGHGPGSLPGTRDE